ncbi:peptidoglycan-binding protein [Anabaena sp. FACHB-1237]|uniref:peptidoglycan-binding domain-containing protein n=1 Tax=Anabaena sp. FACHB-1237 TaxID=2692769 RepID=UPI001680F230|nr:peptidoglycan-binding domain-containing protein [Anabaena sp. FACHB-1237]MBD2138625.1 peptidoglycan-binding protein [Anabaena sp. FACHB-1237]
MTGILSLAPSNLHHFVPESKNYIQQFNRLSSQFISTLPITPPEFIKVEENNVDNLPNLALRRNKIFQQVNQQQIQQIDSGSFMLADAANVPINENPSVKLATRYSPVKSENMPVLGFGSSGISVRVLQRLLLSNGYGVAVDGVFGPVTEVAVKAFQNRHSLSADGIVGHKTWWKLTS